LESWSLGPSCCKSSSRSPWAISPWAHTLWDVQPWVSYLGVAVMIIRSRPSVLSSPLSFFRSREDYEYSFTLSCQFSVILFRVMSLHVGFSPIFILSPSFVLLSLSLLSSFSFVLPWFSLLSSCFLFVAPSVSPTPLGRMLQSAGPSGRAGL
jgi:hypothetical protein